MSVEVYENKNGTLIYHLPDEIDHYQADYLKRKTDGLFERREIKNVVFDFSDTNFMDSSGIGLVTGRYRKVLDNGGKAYAINVSESIDKLLLMSGIYRIVDKIENLNQVI